MVWANIQLYKIYIAVLDPLTIEKIYPISFIINGKINELVFDFSFLFFSFHLLLVWISVYLQRLQSNASHVLLKAVEPSISGKFSCEVSADAPSFHTELQSAEMDVVGKC